MKKLFFLIILGLSCLFFIYILILRDKSSHSVCMDFICPHGVTVDSNGNIYVADTDNHCIQKFSPDGTFVAKWGGRGSRDGEFRNPCGIALDSNGNIYVSDAGNNRIQKFSPDGTFVAKWGGKGSGNEEFRLPFGVSLDRNGNIYVTDFGNNCIKKFSPDGTFIAKWGSYGSGDGEFNSPQGVVVDNNGNIYVADAGNCRIQKFSPDGTFMAKWGSHAKFRYPRGVTVDSNGNIYVADSTTHRIQMLSPDGTFVIKWGSQGSGDGEFRSPHGVTVDSNGNIYVADTNNHRIQKFSPDGTFVTKWGSYGLGDEKTKKKVTEEAKKKGLPMVIKDRVLGTELVLVKGGWFEMGDNFGDSRDGDTKELPVHKVYVDDFYLGKYEVTFEEYDRFCEEEGIKKPDDEGWDRGKRPVSNVNWDDAIAFCRWMGKKTGEKYRLPTEAEWEYAARAGGKKIRYPWGNDVPDKSQCFLLGRYSKSSQKVNMQDKNKYLDLGMIGYWELIDYPRAIPVGKYPPNDLGLYDMAGNVGEWCSDLFDIHNNYYEECKNRYPDGIKNPSTLHGSFRVARGGSVGYDPHNIRCSFRSPIPPVYSGRLLGFRLLREP